MAAKKESSEEKKSSSRKKSSAVEETPVEEKKSRRKSSKKDDVVETVETTDAVSEPVQDIEAAAPQTEPEQADLINEVTSDVQEKQTDAEENFAGAEATPSQDSVQDNIKRYDIMITSENAGYRPPRAAVVSMVQQLSFRGFAKPYDEAIAEKWTEIYFEPGVSAHEIFLEKAYTSDAPVFKELCLRFSEKPFFCDYTSTPKRPLYWGIEIRGCRFTNPLGAFRKFFVDALHIRVDVAHRDFVSLPEHAVVPEDEKPVEKKKHERGAGIAGSEVQEM